MKPYAFIQLEDSSTNGIERVKYRITQDGKNPSDFSFRQFPSIPDDLIDSFSLAFMEASMKVGKGIIVTVARPYKILIR